MSNLLSQLDWLAPRGKTETSHAAAEKVQLTVRYKREVVLETLRQAGVRGVIAYDCWQDCFPEGTLESSIRPRFTELCKKGLAYRTNLKRMNGRGNDESVYRIVDGQ